MKKLISFICMFCILFVGGCGNGAAEAQNETANQAQADAAQNEAASQAQAETAQNEAAGQAQAETAQNDAASTQPESEAGQTAAQPDNAQAAAEPEYVEYVVREGVTPKMVSLSQLNAGNQVRLAEKLKKARDGGEITIAFIGGSITQGTSAGSDNCYAKRIHNWFKVAYSGAKVNYINAGIGATGSYIGVHRADTDVISHNPDIVFVEFSVNDTTEATERNINSYDSLIRKLWLSESAPAVIAIATTQENGTSFQQYHLETAKAYDIPFISYKDAILDVIKEGYIVWDDISDDNIHPNTDGHKALADLLVAYLTDVTENLDSITGAESDFTTAQTADKYKNARLIRPGADEVKQAGIFEVTENDFGGFKGTWRGSAAGETDSGSSIVFEVEAQNIALMYGRLRNKAGSFEVIIDGESVKTINAQFPNGWGDYVEVAEVASFEETGVHTVEIKPVPVEDGSETNFVISSLAVS
ncbi:MAG: SGNH/GDSL hydrolase family protein [Clostridiales bacterium]|nr:SGNH/GDSL hydrolase family protein [Clostridiales bacterium]